MEISAQEIAWMEEHYGGLRLKNATTIVGTLRFRAARKGHDNKIAIWHSIPPLDEASSARHFIEDAYDIFVSVSDDIPHARETGGRIAKTPGKHVFPNSGLLCLGSPPLIYMEVQKSPGIRNFFEKFLIPYFYYHSHIEKYGAEPWPGLPHECAHIFLDIYRYKESIDETMVKIVWQYLQEKEKILLMRGKRSMFDTCLCHSGKKAKDCHPKLTSGFNILRKAIRRG